MKQLHSIVLVGGIVRHFAVRTGPESNHTYWTICGLTPGYKDRDVVVVDSKYGVESTRACMNCVRTRASSRDVDTVLPDIDVDAAARGRAIAEDAAVRLIEARVYRVQGSTDTYTVTVPDSPDFASLCTCMAAKTHPENMCKHQVAVLLVEAREVGSEV